jgi:hypothetical protein
MILFNSFNKFSINLHSFNILYINNYECFQYFALQIKRHVFGSIYMYCCTISYRPSAKDKMDICWRSPALTKYRLWSFILVIHVSDNLYYSIFNELKLPLLTLSKIHSANINCVGSFLLIRKNVVLILSSTFFYKGSKS